MTMAGVTEFPSLFAAGANLFGVVNFETFFSQTEPWMAAISTMRIRRPQDAGGPAPAPLADPQARRSRPPLIVLHGANDTNVPVVEAEQIVEA